MGEQWLLVAKITQDEVTGPLDRELAASPSITAVVNSLCKQSFFPGVFLHSLQLLCHNGFPFGHLSCCMSTFSIHLIHRQCGYTPTRSVLWARGYSQKPMTAQVLVGGCLNLQVLGCLALFTGESGRPQVFWSQEGSSPSPGTKGQMGSQQGLLQGQHCPAVACCKDTSCLHCTSVQH